jgi:hypothetical protein
MLWELCLTSGGFYFGNRVARSLCSLHQACTRIRNGFFLTVYQTVKSKAVPLHAMEVLGGRGGIAYSSYSFTTSAVDGGEWSASRPGESTPGTHCTGGWVSLRAGLDTEVRGKIFCPCQGSNPDRPVVQSVVRHYTAWATRLLLTNSRHTLFCNKYKICFLYSFVLYLWRPPNGHVLVWPSWPLSCHVKCGKFKKCYRGNCPIRPPKSVIIISLFHQYWRQVHRMTEYCRHG